MTVKRDSLDCPDLQDKAKTTRATGGELATHDLADLAGNCSRKEEKAVLGKKVEMVHNQVMRIREEDSLIGEDVADGGSEKSGGRNHRVASSPVFFSRPILPCSPLGGKASRRHGIALN